MKTYYSAVLHLRNKDYLSVLQLGGKVSVNLTANKTIFTDPDPTVEALDTEVEKLNTAIKSKDGSKQHIQAVNDQAVVVHRMLKMECIYVNKIAQGDRNLILLSGFDSNNDPTPHVIPEKALIKRIEDGNTAYSAKIYVAALASADRYKVEITTTPADPASWKTVLDYGVLNRMEIRDLIKGQEIFIRVSGGNSLGWGIPSEPASFIPR